MTPADAVNPPATMNILIVYSTVDGHTLEICQRLRQRLESGACHLTMMTVADANGTDLAAFDKVVIGASIRYGKHRPELVDFLKRHGPALNSRPTALFSVNLVARKPAKNQPDTNPYMRKLLGQLPWRPAAAAVFAGKIDYPRYDFLDRQIIRFIMWLTDGPTDRSAVIDFTDWAQVDAFADAIGRLAARVSGSGS